MGEDQRSIDQRLGAPTPQLGHKYPGAPGHDPDNPGDCFTSNCAYGCGCWAGPSRSGGPERLDPFGECPNHPDREKDTVPDPSPELPPDGHWPCQTEPGAYAVLPPRLVAALYLLLRDHVQPGDLEQVLINVGPHTTDTETRYTNDHLLSLARSHATYLLEGQT